MHQKVLLVDNDAAALDVTKRFLKNEGYAVMGVSEPAQAMLSALDSRPDIVVSDVDMPGMTGIELCRALKRDPRTQSIPVILLTGAYTDDEDLVDGIGQGADDYLLKPIKSAVLSAKIQAVLRRYASPKELEEVLRAGDIVLSVEARTLTLKGRRLQLTRKEFDLLTAFMRQPGRLLKFNFLLETVWGYDPAVYNDPHTVEVHVSSLRRKLGPALGGKVASVPGLGYRYDP
jgi:two-component system phosphate regulon response regulator PhoB